MQNIIMQFNMNIISKIKKLIININQFKKKNKKI